MLRYVLRFGFLPLLLTTSAAYAQYRGGAEDGNTAITAGKMLLTDISGFHGSNDDGVVAATFTKAALTDASSTRGGSGTGFSQSFAAKQNFDDPTSFRGGAGTGFTNAGVLRVALTDNNAFTGGADDGMAFHLLVRQSLTEPAAFIGGGSDGFVVASYAKNAALPVQITSFSGRWNNTSALLSWQTASEDNVRAFVIERSVDGIVFTTVGTVQANGNVNAGMNYQFSDDAAETLYPGQQRFYYRLKTVDHDGRFALSGVVVLQRSTGNGFAASIFPNPANASIHVTVTQYSEPAQLQLLLVDLSGHILRKIRVNAVSMDIPSASLLPGQYFISIWSKDQLLQTISLIIQH